MVFDADARANNGASIDMELIVYTIILVFIWLVAPSIIIHYKGRRWWAWLPLAFVLPGAFLIIAMFMHGVDKDGKKIIS